MVSDWLDLVVACLQPASLFRPDLGLALKADKDCSKSSLEGERKQVTVLWSAVMDLRGKVFGR